MDKKLIPFILLIAMLIFAFQFFYNRSLWLDEAMLANNIISKDFAGLLQPLDYKQIAPILFLITGKLFSILIPDSELGLRLFPLLCFWLACFYFYKTLLIIFKHNYTIVFALSVFGFNALLIYYSNEVKQYMSDVLVCVILYYILIKDYKNIRNKYLSLAIAGCLAILISNITPVILLSTAIYLCFALKLKDKDQFVKLAKLFSFWMLIFLIYFYFFIYHHPTREFMVIYWGKVNAFMPKNPFDPAFYQFILYQIIPNLISLFNFHNLIKLLIGIFILTGFINITFIVKNKIYILLISPVFIHLALSAFEIYPFDIRFILYFIPAFTIMAAFGFDFLMQKLSQGVLINRIIVLVLPLIFLINLLFYLPFQREEIKKSLTYLNENIKKGDKIYIYFAADIAFQYYKNIHYFDYPDNEIIKGKSYWNSENKLYQDDLKYLSGSYWLVFSHISDNEEIKLKDKLSAAGQHPIHQLISPGSSIYLYKFN